MVPGRFRVFLDVFLDVAAKASLDMSEVSVYSRGLMNV